MKIVIVDYGMGNIKSIISALKYLNVDNVLVSRDKVDIAACDKLILPGVGSFGQAISNIRKLELDKILFEEVIEKKKPILGICLGFQLMTKHSDEDGLSDGLGFINANIKKFQEKSLKIPHVGFNQVRSPKNSKLYEGLNSMSDFYFTHSYQAQSSEAINQAICEYGNEFIVSYEVDNIAGVQFHPELSQTNGLKLLENFIKNF